MEVEEEVSVEAEAEVSVDREEEVLVETEVEEVDLEQEVEDDSHNRFVFYYLKSILFNQKSFINFCYKQF